MYKRLGLIVGMAAGALLATAASATTFTFTGADETATANNTLDYTVDGITLDVYGAHMNDGRTSTSSVTYTTLETWAGYGMGVMFSGDRERNGTHQIDNVGAGVDFVILSFSQAVSLDAINRVAWGISNIGSYSDASYLAYSGAAGSITSLDTSTFSSLPQGTSATNTDIYSKVWLVAADVNGSTDGFKLTTLNVTAAAVPETATWGMMVIGFGAMGAALRRRRPAQGAMFIG